MRWNIREQQKHICGPADHDDRYICTFDGSTDPQDPAAGGGAGAALWAPPSPAGVRACIATIERGLPGLGHAQEAEAWALRAAITLILDHCPSHADVLIMGPMGDNLPLIRSGGGQGRLLQARALRVIDGPLQGLALRGGHAWACVPRRLNGLAHTFAQGARDRFCGPDDAAPADHTVRAFAAAGLELPRAPRPRRRRNSSAGPAQQRRRLDPA